MLTNNKLINGIFLGSSIIILLILVMIATVSQPENLSINLTPDLMNCFYRIGASIAVLSIITFLINKIQTMSKINFWSLICVIFVIQIIFVIVFKRPLTTDTAYVFNQSEQLANSNYEWLKYFKIYPNNVMISIFWMFFYRIFNIFNISNHYNAAVLVQTILYDLSLIFAYNQLKLIPNFRDNWFLLIGIAYFPLWLFNIFVYNDVIGISIIYFCIGFFTKYIYLSESKLREYFYFFMLILILSFGIMLRQNLIIILIALLITIIFTIKKSTKEKLILIVIIGSILGLMNLGSKGIEKQFNYETDNQIMMPTISWVNMGLNVHSSGKSDTYDTWNWYSLKEPERTKELKKSIKYRLTTTPKKDLIKLFWHKARITFAAGLPLMDFKNVNSYLFNINTPRFMYVLAQIIQPIYIVFFVLAILSVIQNLRKLSNLNPLVVFCILSIVGVFMFHTLLWESRDRYGIVILPFIFILISMIDFDRVKLNISSKKSIFIIGLFSLLLLVIGSITNIKAVKNEQIINRETNILNYYDYTYSHPMKLMKNTEYKFKFKSDNFSNLLVLQIKDKKLTKDELDKINIHIYNKKRNIINTHAVSNGKYRVKMQQGEYIMKVNNYNAHNIKNSRLFIYSNKQIKWPNNIIAKKNNKIDYSIEPSFVMFEQKKQTVITFYYYIFIYIIYLFVAIFGMWLRLNYLKYK